MSRGSAKLRDWAGGEEGLMGSWEGEAVGALDHESVVLEVLGIVSR